MDHIGAGKEWGLDKKSGGLYISGAVIGFRESDGRFLFRDLLHNLSYLEQGDADYILVSSGTLVCNIDYQPLINQHELSGDPVTLVYQKASPGHARPGHYITLDETAVSPASSAPAEANSSSSTLYH
jgi:glucose-1-phosphate adenylyltransferase